MTIKARDIQSHFYNITHDSEKYAEREIEAFENRKKKFAEYVQNLAAQDGVDPAFDADSEIARFNDKTEALHRDYWQALGRCASPMIVGPANFPVERARKARESADKKLERIYESLEKAKKVAKRHAFPNGADGDPIRSGDPEAIQKLRKKLEAEEKAHAEGIRANRVFKKEGIEGLRRIGWPEREIEFAIRSAERGWPYTPYHTSNGSARIRRLKQRIAQLGQVKSQPADNGETVTTPLGDVFMKKNINLMRVQIFFPDKPPADVRKLLKSHGFRWASSQGAWQRHLNNRGVYAAERVLAALRENTSA